MSSSCYQLFKGSQHVISSFICLSSRAFIVSLTIALAFLKLFLDSFFSLSLESSSSLYFLRSSLFAAYLSCFWSSFIFSKGTSECPFAVGASPNGSSYLIAFICTTLFLMTSFFSSSSSVRILLIVLSLSAKNCFAEGKFIFMMFALPSGC